MSEILREVMGAHLKNSTTKSGLNRHLGQFFSPQMLVEKCISLIQNKNGRLLEPSCENLAFKKCFNENAVFIEIDKSLITNGKVLNIDFFDYPVSQKFVTGGRYIFAQKSLKEAMIDDEIFREHC